MTFSNQNNQNSVREGFKCLEQLPSCGKGKAKRTYFDATVLAYKMFDMVFLGMKGIPMLLQSLYDDQQMLQSNSEMRVQRWKRMINEAANLLDGGMVSTLNNLYLNQKDHVTYIFDNQDKLTREQITSHLRFVHIHQLLEQEIELCDLQQPAVGAYADLFTSRAAQEMAEILTPTIARYVDFEYGYQYGAWVKAMMDLKLIRADKRNGTAIIRFVNKTFGEQIDKTTLFRCLSKEGDFEKIKDLYEAIMSVVSQEMDREQRLNDLCKASQTV